MNLTLAEKALIFNLLTLSKYYFDIKAYNESIIYQDSFNQIQFVEDVNNIRKNIITD